MSHEIPIHAPLIPPQAEIVMPPPPPSEATQAVSADQLRIEHELEAKQHEADAVAHLMGVWAGGLLLADLAREQFVSEEEERDEGEPRMKPKPS